MASQLITSLLLDVKIHATVVFLLENFTSLFFFPWKICNRRTLPLYVIFENHSRMSLTHYACWGKSLSCDQLTLWRSQVRFSITCKIKFVVSPKRNIGGKSFRPLTKHSLSCQEQPIQSTSASIKFTLLLMGLESIPSEINIF